MIKIHRDDKVSPGFVMTFDNGYTISIMWGWSNYCSHRDLNKAIENREAAPDTTHTAEVAAWDENGKWLEEWPEYISKNSSDKMVIGWSDANMIADTIAYVAGLKKSAIT